MDFKEIMILMQTGKYTEEHKRVAFLTWVAERLEIRLKDYDLVDSPDSPRAVSVRLFGKGRGTEESRNFMPNRIKQQIELQLEDAENQEEIKEIMIELAYKIVENSILVIEDLLLAGQEAKTPKVRKNYIHSLENRKFIEMVFHLTLVLYSQELISYGGDIKHVYLTNRLESLAINRKVLNDIWKTYRNSEQNDDDLEEAIQKTRAIHNHYQKNFSMTQEDLDQIISEKALYTVMNQQNLFLEYLDIVIDSIIDANIDRFESTE